MSKNRFQKLSSALKGQNLPEQVEGQPQEAAQVTQAKRKKKGKRSDPNFIQVGVYVPKQLHLTVKKLLLDDPAQDMSDLVTHLLQGWVENQQSK